MPTRDGPPHEGAILGFAVATATWGWLALVDALAGDPFRTFDALGGIVIFTVLHYVLNVAYGVAIVSGIRGAKREPSLTRGGIRLSDGRDRLRHGYGLALEPRAGRSRLAWNLRRKLDLTPGS